MPPLFKALHSDRVLLMDGAMGTELQRAGIRQDECYEHWNLTHAEKVQAIHRAYVDAGATCLATNTFQANPKALARHGLQDQLGSIAQAAVKLARAAAGLERFVLLDIGPFELPDLLESWEIIKDLRGADGLLLETWSDVESVGKFLRVAGRELSAELPVLVSFTYWRPPPDHQLRTFTNCTPEACARMADQGGAAALGVNCGRDLAMDDILEVLRRYRALTDLPIFAGPNAGTPTQTGGRWIYPHTPAQMAARLPALLDAGAIMVGGCCGTTPETIAAFRRSIDTRACCKRADFA
jgi:5-methyltetrahydrofolate--homocysteine methyltransferase